MMSNLLTTQQAADALGISTERVRQLAKALDLPTLGRQFVITEKDVKKMAARKTQRGPVKGAKK
ncbi:MAG TPA: helix-turn-helix domain-containing protein [Pyrinomonadaceae bacterium]